MQKVGYLHTCMSHLPSYFKAGVHQYFNILFFSALLSGFKSEFLPMLGVHTYNLKKSRPNGNEGNNFRNEMTAKLE